MSRKEEPPTLRSFGFTFAVVFLLVCFWPRIWRDEEPRYWSLGIAAAFAIAPFAAPRVLAPLNWLWLRIGLALHHIVNPLIMALIYYLAAVPIGLLLRLGRKDLLRLRLQPQAESYWISREPPGPEPGSMSRQF